MQRKSKFNILLGIILALFLVLALTFLAINRFWKTMEAKVKSQDGRVSILILGKAGEGYSAPDLTDTMIFASVSLEKPKVVLVSIPRDIWIPEIRAKVNSAYYWGGFPLAKTSVEKVTGQPIHYALLIDFSGFKKIVDALGGIEVEVENSFVDEKYPIPGKENDLCGGDKEHKCRYETIMFEKGKVKMDGETALKFVRSRNAQADEGTDIAREARQQKVVSAIKERILSKEVLFSPKMLIALQKVGQEIIKTDVSLETGAILVGKLFDAGGNIKTLVLPQEFLLNPLISPKYDNQYVFIPKDGNWGKVREWVDSLIE